MEIRELLQEYGYNADETPIIIGSALCALEVNYRFCCSKCTFKYLYAAVSPQCMDSVDLAVKRVTNPLYPAFSGTDNHRCIDEIYACKSSSTTNFTCHSLYHPV